VTAVEIDAAAAPLIEANAARSGVSVAAVTGDRPPAARTVVANLPRPALLGAPIEAELIIASGMLASEAGEVAAALGRREVERRVEGDWAALVLA
jgi:hypothetical protein